MVSGFGGFGVQGEGSLGLRVQLWSETHRPCILGFRVLGG